MERDIMQQLLIWKKTKDKKPLLLIGVRHCGKTYTCIEFGKNYFDEVACFNFKGNKSYRLYLIMILILKE